MLVQIHSIDPSNKYIRLQGYASTHDLTELLTHGDQITRRNHWKTHHEDWFIVCLKIVVGCNTWLQSIDNPRRSNPMTNHKKTISLTIKSIYTKCKSCGLCTNPWATKLDLWEKMKKFDPVQIIENLDDVGWNLNRWPFMKRRGFREEHEEQKRGKQTNQLDPITHVLNTHTKRGDTRSKVNKGGVQKGN